MAWSLISYLLSGNYTWEPLEKMILYPDTFFWFLWVLFFINIIFIFCQWIADKIKTNELVVISSACILLLGIMVGMEFRMFGFQFLAYYFVFYVVGYCVHRFPRLLTCSRMFLGVMFAIWAMMAWQWNMHELPSWMPTIPHVPTTLLQYAYRGLTALAAILFLMGMAPQTLNGGNRFNRCIGEIGVVSLGCYTCHLTIMGHVLMLLRSIFPNMGDEGLIAMNFIICLGLTLGIVELLKKNKITAKVLLGKVK